MARRLRGIGWGALLAAAVPLVGLVAGPLLAAWCLTGLAGDVPRRVATWFRLAALVLAGAAALVALVAGGGSVTPAWLAALAGAALYGLGLRAWAVQCRAPTVVRTVDVSLAFLGGAGVAAAVPVTSGLVWIGYLLFAWHLAVAHNAVRGAVGRPPRIPVAT